MNNDRRVVDFADRWLQCFTDRKLFESAFGDECLDLGFSIKDGNAMVDRMSNESYDNPETLKIALAFYADSHMLGSLILYKWRSITHWLQGDLLSDMNREWFKVALTRLKDIGQMESHSIYITYSCIVGSQYVDGSEMVLAALCIGDGVMLRAELDNPYDDYSIVVEARGANRIGYVSRRNNHIPYRLIKGGKTLYGVISEIDYSQDTPKIGMKIYMQEENEIVNDMTVSSMELQWFDCGPHYEGSVYYERTFIDLSEKTISVKQEPGLDDIYKGIVCRMSEGDEKELFTVLNQLDKEVSDKKHKDYNVEVFDGYSWECTMRYCNNCVRVVKGTVEAPISAKDIEKTINNIMINHGYDRTLYLFGYSYDEEEEDTD